jgi:hypothetical protein
MTAFWDLTSKPKEELWALARELEPYIGKLAPATGEPKLREAIEIGLMKRQKALEQQVTDEANKERLAKIGADDARKRHPCPETIAIEASDKVFCTFLNMENPGQDGEMGADVSFWKGDKYQFHLFDGQRHVMPRCLIVSNPEADTKVFDRMVAYWSGLGMDDNRAKKQAKNSLRQMALPVSCVAPRFELRFDPRTNRDVMVLAGHTPRFQFTDVESAPADAEFGLVVPTMSESEK